MAVATAGPIVADAPVVLTMGREVTAAEVVVEAKHNLVGELKELNELRTQGVLTDEEFKVAKEKVLAQP